MALASSVLIERAPAKVNLTLHVVGRKENGWHELESLVAFTAGGDVLSLTPGEMLGLTLEGPTASLAGDNDQNLVLKAARNLSSRVDGLRTGAFHLVKHLPVAAGVGGGSSDAAAALRLLARANEIAFDDPRLQEAARETGADVPVCLDRCARMMEGVGEKLGEPLRLPPLVGLIVNPGQALETKAVFATMNLAPGTKTHYGAHPALSAPQDMAGFLAALRKGRNDMEDAACVLAPVIGSILAVLSAARGCQLARMSGSGATCYALFTDCRAALKARQAILKAHPEWWVKACVFR
ncbi:4-(cytidine 5'-diphospho)-2-C-methyl-D-erythritol kinase [Beijerinckia mobilis]|uniref:4-(cytidine 5'-diphospho)-2-C-methyl-D-erythritol kinase n=1 Tax=Beijerinckia mobilis TaxID=231434 RepID=UPI00054F2D0A|nr:4-(cytidine 5'-diphospho)-2-C-methyl-D-erythritol kinase [Beijerinckia mobilis]